MPDSTFQMVIAEVWWLAQRGGPIVVATDWDGDAAVGDQLDLRRRDGSRRRVRVVGIELHTRHETLGLVLDETLSEGEVTAGDQLSSF